MADTEAILDPMVSCEIFFIIIYLGVFYRFFFLSVIFLLIFYKYFLFFILWLNILCVCSLNKYFVIYFFDLFLYLFSRITVLAKQLSF